MAATRFLRRGVQVKVVSEMLGQASIAVTLQIYAHVLPNMQREAAAMTSKMLGDETEN
jgi:integrase